jgi:hypothetical protein
VSGRPVPTIHISPDRMTVVVACPGLESTVLNELGLPLTDHMLISIACTEHAQRCSACDIEAAQRYADHSQLEREGERN